MGRNSWLCTIIMGILKSAFKETFKYFSEYINEAGGDVIEGLHNGITNALTNIGIWIYDHIFKPFINGFKKAFGIASPSKVMKEQGGFLMEGLFNGVSELVDKVVSVFKKIKDKVIEIWEALKSKTAEIWNGIKEVIKKPINGIIGFINGMISGVVDGINGMINALNKISVNVPDWVPLIGGKTLGFNISAINAPQIPYLAKGGLVYNPTIAQIGEAGEEAILPLTNRRTMSMIADSIMENVQRDTDYYNFNNAKTDNNQTNELLKQVQQQNQLLREQNKILSELNQNAIVLDDNNFEKRYRSAAGNFYRRTGSQLGLLT